MTDNTPKPMTAEELAKEAHAAIRKSEYRDFGLITRAILLTGHSLVKAIDRNTEALKDLKLIVQHPITVIEREREGGTR